jgi:hypothetical protein
MITTPLPRLHIIDDRAVPQGRLVSFQFNNPGAAIVSIRFAKETKLLAVGLPGRALTIPADGLPAKAVLSCSGRSCSTLVFEALLGSRAPVRAELFSYLNMLPKEAQPLIAARPPHAVPQYSADETVTMKRISF